MEKKRRIRYLMLGVIIFFVSWLLQGNRVNESYIKATAIEQPNTEVTGEEDTINFEEEVVEDFVTKEPIETVSKSAISVRFQETVIKLAPKEYVKNPVIVSGIKKYKIAWKVSNKKYAQITNEGRIHIKKKGIGKRITVTATLTYTVDEKKEQQSVKYTIIGQKNPDVLNVLSKKNYVFVGKTRKLKVEQRKEKKKISWKSSNEKYATISKNGIIKPKKAGAGKMVTFTAQADDLRKTEGSISLRIIDLNKPMVALTFDDGPSLEYTTRIVNQLKKYEARATFFVLGSKLESKSIQKLLQDSYANGNEIASHTYNHYNLANLSSSSIISEATKTEGAIQKITGAEVLLTRPPYGSFNNTVRANIYTPLILWSIDTKDWQTRNAGQTFSVTLNSVKDGDIILMHDIYEQTAVAAEQIIPELVNKGYQLVTVSELATYKKVSLKDGQTYSAIR